MRRLALVLVLSLSACSSGAPDEPAVFSCATLGMTATGTMSAVVTQSIGTNPFQPTCFRASLTDDRVVIRGIQTSGPLIVSDILLTALTTQRASLDIAAGQASASYAANRRALAAIEGSVTISVLSETTIAGAFEFVTEGGATERVTVAAGQFQLPR